MGYAEKEEFEGVTTEEFMLYKKGDQFILEFSDEGSFCYLDEDTVNAKLRDLWYNPEYHMDIDEPISIDPVTPPSAEELGLIDKL